MIYIKSITYIYKDYRKTIKPKYLSFRIKTQMKEFKSIQLKVSNANKILLNYKEVK